MNLTLLLTLFVVFDCYAVGSYINENTEEFPVWPMFPSESFDYVRGPPTTVPKDEQYNIYYDEAYDLGFFSKIFPGYGDAGNQEKYPDYPTPYPIYTDESKSDSTGNPNEVHKTVICILGAESTGFDAYGPVPCTADPNAVNKIATVTPTTGLTEKDKFGTDLPAADSSEEYYITEPDLPIVDPIQMIEIATNIPIIGSNEEAKIGSDLSTSSSGNKNVNTPSLPIAGPNTENDDNNNFITKTSMADSIKETVESGNFPVAGIPTTNSNSEDERGQGDVLPKRLCNLPFSRCKFEKGNCRGGSCARKGRKSSEKS